MDCKVAIRKFVLIARPSKWAQKGDRVVVQSPVQNITNESAIPVRRFNGDEENSVCFMPVQDIEEDSSVAYKNALVTSKSTPIDTHGVALFRSVSDFDYQPGDRFWLFIGPERSGYEKDVPVINLRTIVAGSVPIFHVCWFPKMRGPGNEVWTFGGRVRKQKLSGRNNFTFWSWGICQYLDGKPATTKAIQIPIRNVNTDKQQWLLSSEAWPLFSHIHKNMIKDRPQIFSPLLPPPQSSSWAGSSNSVSRDLHTPPLSPCMENSKPLDEGSSPAPTLISKKLDKTAWKSIMDLASKGTLRPLQGSIIHPQRTSSSPDRRKYRRTDVDDTRSDSGCSDNTARPSTRPPSLTMENGNIRPRSDDLRKLILAQDGGGALCLTDMAQEVAKQVANSRIQDSEQPVLSAAHSVLRTSPTILSTRYQIKKNMPTIEFLTSERYHIAELCDLGKYNCEWSLRFVSKHYHPDHRKCIMWKWIPKHEHCISSVRALPNTAGPCLLIEGAHEHQCCVWEDEDMKDWHAPTKKEFDEAKIAEVRQNIMDSDRLNIKIPDQIIDESKNIKEEKWIPVMSDEVLDGSGKWLRDEFGKGNYSDEI